MDKGLRKLIYNQFFFSSAMALGWVFVYPYLAGIGVSITEMIIFSAMLFAIPVALLLNTIKANSKSSMAIGLACRAMSFILLPILFLEGQLYLIAIFFGIHVAYFWIPFNVMYHGATHKGNRAFLNSFVFFLYPVTGAMLPALGGAIAQSMGYGTLFTLGAILIMASIVPVLMMKKERIMDIGAKGLGRMQDVIIPLTFIEGTFIGAVWVGIPLITLTFIQQPLGFGVFFSYLGLMGAAASLIAGKISDKSGKRREIAISGALLASVSMFLAAMSTSLEAWAFATGLVYFFVNITLPFMWTLVAEYGKSPRKPMIAREIGLNAGRVFGIVIIAACHFVGMMPLALAIAACVFALYPIAYKITGARMN